MTITVNSNCSTMSLDSSYLASTNQTVTLFWNKNCNVTTSEITISSLVSTINLVPADLDEVDTFSDGVYYFKLTVVQEDGSIVEESLCKFLNCNSSCLMLPIYKMVDTESFAKIIAFEGLLASENCSSCSCSNLCLLYNNTGLTTIDNDNCGCN